MCPPPTSGKTSAVQHAASVVPGALASCWVPAAQALPAGVDELHAQVPSTLPPPASTALASLPFGKHPCSRLLSRHACVHSCAAHAFCPGPGAWQSRVPCRRRCPLHTPKQPCPMRARRYCPVALLEVVPQRLHWRAPAYVGRSDLETLLASDRAADWVRGSCHASMAVPLVSAYTIRSACSQPEGHGGRTVAATVTP